MEEALKALAPWPMLQGIAIGLVVAGIGFWAVKRGLQEGRRRDGDDAALQTVRLQLTEEELRLHWEAHKQLDHIHENSFAMVKHMEKMVEQQLMMIAAVNRLADARWNKHQ